MYSGAITVGMLTPHATPGPGVEMPDMAPGRVNVEVSRICTTVSGTPRNLGSITLAGLGAQPGYCGD